MTYQITVESPHHATVTFARKRRDSAEYLFRRSVCRNVWPRDCVRSDRPGYMLDRPGPLGPSRDRRRGWEPERHGRNSENRG